MKIATWNINGFRSAQKKDFYDFIEVEKPDILNLQEVKTQDEGLFANMFLQKFSKYFNFAEKKGYAGVASFCIEKPNEISTDLSHERFDSEGRMLWLEYDDFVLLNLYMPHGARDKSNLGYKLEAYEKLIEYLKCITKPVIVVGDMNIARSDLDVANYQQNKNNIMFTPAEREIFDRLLALGLVDVFRDRNPETRAYTWWPYAFEAKKRDLGWRIDYVLVSESLTSKVKNIEILKKYNASDHCPVCLDINI